VGGGGPVGVPGGGAWWHARLYGPEGGYPSQPGTYAANEGLVRIQYKYLVPIYVFPEMKPLFLKQNYNVLSPSSYTHISVRDLYISRIGLPILLQENMRTDPGNIEIAHRHMSVEIGT
jgi:hypothetical protein